MIKKAKAKINIGLRIVGKRADGYHLLESLMYPLSLHDIVEIVVRSDDDEEDRLQSFGIITPDEDKDNLVMKAVRLFRERFYPQMPPLDIALYKNIPFGAGMGGGSSDATATMRLLRKLFDIEISDDALREASLMLGADCPFFVEDTPQIARGIGEILTTFDTDEIKNKYLLLIKPSLAISTKEAFAGVKIGIEEEIAIEDILKSNMINWQNKLRNYFEDTLFPIYPELKEIKDWMKDNSAIYTAMTGSGATIFGFFDKDIIELARNRFPDYFVFSQIC